MKRLFGIWFALWFANVSYASENTASGDHRVGDVEIRVWSVLAVKAGATMAAGLQPIAKHLEALDYGSFTLLRKDAINIPSKGTRRIETAGDKAVRVTVLDRNAERARVRIQIASNGQTVLDTTVAVRRNGFFIVAGPKHEDGILVLPIFARY